jgi:hypothetical protein
VITEGALRQTVGPARVMREQLAWLADAAEAGYVGPSGGSGVSGPRAPISLRVLPFTEGAHAAAGSGSMTLLRFAEAPEIGIVHLAALSGGVSLEGRAEVGRYLRTFTRLQAAALPPARSARVIRSIARGYNN